MDENTIKKKIDSIGERIKYCIRQKGYTQKEIVIKTGLKESTVSDTVNNRHKPSLETLILLSDALECSMDYLISGDKSTYIGENNTVPQGDKIMDENTINQKIDSIGERIKYCIKQKGYTQKEIVKKTGLKESTVSEAINNRHKPRLETLILLSDALECSMDYLINGNKSTFIENNDEQILIENFRQLGYSDQRFVIDLVSLKVSQKKQKSEPLSNSQSTENKVG